MKLPSLIDFCSKIYKIWKTHSLLLQLLTRMFSLWAKLMAIWVVWQRMSISSGYLSEIPWVRKRMGYLFCLCRTLRETWQELSRVIICNYDSVGFLANLISLQDWFVKNLFSIFYNKWQFQMFSFNWLKLNFWVIRVLLQIMIIMSLFKFWRYSEIDFVETLQWLTGKPSSACWSNWPYY